MKITSEDEYEKIMEEILDLMNKGEGNLENAEKERLRTLAVAAQFYEHNLYTIPTPNTLEGILLQSEGQFTITFIKAVHTKLNISADFILQHI